MAHYDEHRFAYYRFIRDRGLYPEFKKWCKELRVETTSIRKMSMFLVHKGLRNELVGEPRYDRDADLNLHDREIGLTPIFDLTDEEYKEIICAKWTEE